MGQVTIYLDDATEERVRAAARAAGVPLGRWVAGRIERSAGDEWPAHVRQLAGAWADLPSPLKLRKPRAKDVVRCGL